MTTAALALVCAVGCLTPGASAQSNDTIIQWFETEWDDIERRTPDFFLAAVTSLGCAPGDTVMIGDDAEMDVAGAIAAGLDGILVQTGKYRAGDEAKCASAAVVTDLPAAVARLLA